MGGNRFNVAWFLLVSFEYDAKLEEDGEFYTDEHGRFRCKHGRDAMGTCAECDSRKDDAT